MPTTATNLTENDWVKILDVGGADRDVTVSSAGPMFLEITTADTKPTMAISDGMPIKKVEGWQEQFRESMKLKAGEYLWAAPGTPKTTRARVLV